MRLYLLTSAIFFAGFGLCFAQQAASDATASDRAAIQKAAEAFVASFNAHDAKALVALFAPDAEIMERDGTRLVGTEEILAGFEDAFAQNPKSKISVAVDSLRFIAPGVAIEEGRNTWFPDGDQATMESTYRVAHVKRNNKWLMVGVRTIDDNALSNYEYLREFEWLIGDWIDEDAEAVVETSFSWAPKKAFLLRSFSVKSKGQVVLSGTQRIGWDAHRKQFRSWTFDSEGGFVEGTWTAVGDGYVVRSSGYTSDGLAVSGTSRFDRRGSERFVWSMFNRLRGSEIMPDTTVTVVRKPPTPEVAKK